MHSLYCGEYHKNIATSKPKYKLRYLDFFIRCWTFMLYYALYSCLFSSLPHFIITIIIYKIIIIIITWIQVYPANNRIISISLECITAFTNCNQLTIQQLGNLKERYLLLSNLRDVQIFKCLCRLMCDQLKYRPKATTKAMPSYLFTLRSLLFSSVISLSAIADDNCYRFVARVFGELAKNYSLLRRYFPLIITDYIG